MSTKFFEISQNNSGGSFTTDDKLCHRLIIEAENEDKAIEKAEQLGCYWDGVDLGMDCSCCGDRWSQYTNEIDIETYKTKGYPAYHYSSIFQPKDWFKKFGEFKRKEEPSIHAERAFGDFGTEIFFDSIEDYAQFMSNSYGWTTPDCRIFYLNGTVKEIFSNK